ncbi:AP-4 complex subunit mu [Cyclospora cayetanensis]|uniref:AP-4 complex subunit mu n=1 Tax=Cyclospora cayetanensis TaxID=88456 RepID=A0A6P6RYS7_9EIME|nr:AP-4 complex subunit mu [Cyclospora cayetanensis]
MPSTASRRPVAVSAAAGSGSSSAAAAAARRRSEIFVDVIERLSAVLSRDGRVLHASLDGCIQMKSYLDTPPLMKLALSDQLSIGSSGLSEGGALCTDSCNFHECVDLALFESQRLLTFRPPDGEFVLLNYRAVSVSHVPFRVLPTVEELGNGKVDVILRIRADLPEQSCAANVSVSVSLPKATTSVALESMPPVAAQGMEFIAAEHRIHWLIKKFQGGCELSFRVRVTLNPALPPPLRSEYGPATLGFEIPMYNVSSLQVGGACNAATRAEASCATPSHPAFRYALPSPLFAGKGRSLEGQPSASLKRPNTAA